MTSHRALFAVVACTIAGGACPGGSTATPATTTPAATTSATTTAPPSTTTPMPTTPLPSDAVRPFDSDASRLASSIVALGDGPWSPSGLLGQPAGDTARPRSPLFGATTPTLKPTTPLALPPSMTKPRSFQGLGKEVAMPVGDLTLTFTMQDGSWEPSTGNSLPRMDEPIVAGITLSGPGGLASPAPTDAVAHEVMADATGAATSTTTALVWGRSLSFQQGSVERPFVLTRFVGRAPFQYSPAEHRALEDALIAITTALKEPIHIGELIATRFKDRRVSSTDDGEVYDFGAGTLTVKEQFIRVEPVGPMRLPRFFAARGIRSLTTSFAHNFGRMPETIHGAGFDLSVAWTFEEDGRRRGPEAEDGLAAEARVLSLWVAVKPRQIGDLPPSSR